MPHRCAAARLFISSIAFVAYPTLDGCARATICSIQVAHSTPRSEWVHLTQISRTAAEKIARDRLDSGPSGRVVAANLTSDAGCLVWSVELHLPGEHGISEVHVDAGTGSVLLVKHGSDHPGKQSDAWFYE
jgi:hypothetical protein